MSKSKSKLALVIALTAVLAIVFTLVFPAVVLETQTFKPGDSTYIFGFTTIFGGTIQPVGSGIKAVLGFNVGSFLAVLFLLIAATLVFFFDKQFSSYAFALILSIASGVLFLFNERFVLEANGVISGFTNYMHTGFGTWVSLGFCCLILIECACGIYILNADRTRRHH